MQCKKVNACQNLVVVLSRPSIKESLNVEFFGFKMVAKMLIWSFGK